MRRKRTGIGVEPVRRTDKIFEVLRRRNVFDSKRNDAHAVMDGPLHLTGNLRRSIGMLRKNENHDLAFFNPFDYRFAVLASRQYIARGNPAANAVFFQSFDNRPRFVGILRGMADKNVKWFLGLGGALAGFDHNSQCCEIPIYPRNTRAGRFDILAAYYIKIVAMGLLIKLWRIGNGYAGRMNFKKNLQSKFPARALLLAFLYCAVILPAAEADSRFKDLSAAEREKAIRQSLFAPDNPEHVVASAAEVVPSQGEAQRNSQPAVGERVPQPGGRGGPGYSVQPNPAQQGGQDQQIQYGSQRNYNHREKIPVQNGRPSGAGEDSGVAVDNGGVHINTGNNSIDRSVESFIDRKVRGAQSAIRSLWR